MCIRWTTLAAADLESIKNFLEKYYPHFSRLTIRKLYDCMKASARSRPCPRVAAWG
jgi:plasmid stabilization system protein ParE